MRRSVIYFIFQIWLMLFAVAYLVADKPWNAFVASALAIVFWELWSIRRESEDK